MFQMIIAILYGLAVLTFTGLSTIELWKSGQSKFAKIIGTTVFAGLGLAIMFLTFWLVTIFKLWI